MLSSAFYWFAQENKWLSDDYQKQNELILQQEKFDHLYLFIQKAESGVRAYASTDNTKYVKNIGASLDSIRFHYQEIKKHLQTENTTIGIGVYAEFDSLIREKIAFMEMAKSLCDANDCAGALQLIATERGIDLTNAILAINENTSIATRKSLNESKEKFARVNNLNNNTAYIGIGAALLIIVIVIYLLKKEIKRTKSITDQLRIQKDYLRITLNSIGEGLIATGKDGKIVFMNPAAEKLTGWKNAEAKNLPLQDIYNVFNEETGKPFESVAHRILKEGIVIAFENNTILKTKDQGSIIISNTGSPLLNKTGKIEGALLVFKDITQQKKDEEKIKSSEKRLRDMIEHLPEAIYTCDADGYIKMFNKAAVKLWGREPVIGKELWSGSWKIVNKDGSTIPAEESPMAIAIKECKPVYGKELTIIREDGTIRQVLPNPTPLFDENGKNTGAVNMLIDITDKKEREILIKKTEEKYKNLIEQASDAIVVYSIDGKIHEFNTILCSISGYTHDEISQLHLQDILVGKLIESPEKYEAMTKGETVTLNRQFRRKNGELVEMEIRAKAISDNKFLAFARDITERKKAEQALKESSAVQKLIMNSALDAIICINTEGQITVWNPVAEKTFGWSESEVIGRPLTETIIPARYREQHNAGMKRYLQTGVGNVLNKTIEISAINHKGNELPVELSIVSIKNADTQFFCAFIRDISERQKAQKNILEKNSQLQVLSEHLQEVREEERTSMAREIHDELGQQLTVMKMDVAWLQDNLRKDESSVFKRFEEFKSMLDLTVNTVRRIAYELRPSILDDMGLGPAIEWQLVEFEKRSGVKCIYNGEKEKLPLNDNARTGLFRIVQESLTNVGRYAKAEQVKVSLRQEEHKIILTIMDDGVGFEPDKLAFRKTLGILGMKERCTMVGGVFEINSTPGSGTTIKVIVPVQSEITDDFLLQ